MTKRKPIIVAAVLAAVALIVLVNVGTSGGKNFDVTVEKVRKRDLVEKVSATGEIKPKKNVNISTDVAGKILKILVAEGETVSQGQLLIKIDSAVYEANADGAREVISSSEAELISQEATLKQAKQFLERRRRLVDEGLISREQFEDAATQYEIAAANRKANLHRIEQARASLKSTSDSIQKTSIVSPIDGIVTSLNVEEGEVAIIGTMNNPGTVLMTIADLSVMEAEVLVDETDVVKVKPGKRAHVTVDALPGRIMEGTVTEVGNSAVSALASIGGTAAESKDFKTVITLEAPPPSLKPGFSATADIIIEEKKGVPSVPIAALVIVEDKGPGKKGGGEEREGVFVASGGKSLFRPVEKGIAGDMHIEITAGLQENEVIVSGPFAVLKRLKDGDRIRYAKEKK
ncbi:MAG: efflux RND transporter periplasmic adaptor subunit [Candidatus Aminicenantes bacterium]|nr:efflux RND transporter periplasmic adaptor subunit [Candidatus Aminicenantes bacterium]